MKSVLKIILLFVVIASCKPHNDSPENAAKKDTVVVLKHDTISYNLPYASVAGLYNGECSRGALLNCSGIIVKNNDKGYKIISFECSDVLMHESAKDNNVKNAGATFDKDIIRLFGLFDTDAKFCFENIKAVGMDNDTVTLNPIIINVVGERLTH